MSARIFDRETILDLTVNFVPLFILLFFFVGFILVNPFGFDPMASGLQMLLTLIPFVFLALLTYLSGKAIAGDEKRFAVYLPGQATVDGAKPVHGEQDADDVDRRSAIEMGDESTTGDDESETSALESGDESEETADDSEEATDEPEETAEESRETASAEND
jgi:hypothetical protein